MRLWLPAAAAVAAAVARNLLIPVATATATATTIKKIERKRTTATLFQMAIGRRLRPSISCHCSLTADRWTLIDSPLRQTIAAVLIVF